ncbi:Charged multivesicular body protein 7 [Blastocladiella emersonii ATCC 22665]|nr:Charged multivesicular body protein 7 [Blastocladiella emersonii ATCC 22665]
MSSTPLHRPPSGTATPDEPSASALAPSPAPDIPALIRSIAASEGAHLPTMLAAFYRSRRVNPAAWDAKLAFWHRVVHDVCVAHGAALKSRFTLDARRIAGALAVDGIAPLGMPRVLLELVKLGDLVAVDDFLRASSPGTDAGGAGYLSSLAAPLLWGLSALGVYSSPPTHAAASAEPEIRDGTYVLVARVDADLDQIARLASSVHTLCESLLPLDEFAARLGIPALDTVDARILLSHAQRAGMLAFDPAESLVKLARGRPGAESVVVTEIDRHLAKLKRTMRMVEAQLADAERRIEAILAEARVHLKADRRPSALRCIQRKKNLESVRDKRAATRETLAGILFKVDTSETDTAILGAYQSGTAALRGLLDNPALAQHAVEGTMDALADALADQQELDDAVAVNVEMVNNATAQAAGIDDDLLEAELAELAREEAAAVPAPPAAVEPAPAPTPAPAPVPEPVHASPLRRQHSDDDDDRTILVSRDGGDAGDARHKKRARTEGPARLVAE